MNSTRGYAEDWDDYVKHWKEHVKKEPTNKGRTDLVYPGDEWGTEAEWDAFTETYLRPYLPADSSGTAVEIGPGSGKYTLRVVDLVARLVSFDVSRRFMEIARSRLSAHHAAERVQFERLELKDCFEIQNVLARERLLGLVDLFFSVDSMQHVELHTLVAYWINAAACLRPGGHLVMTVATATSDGGYERLLQEVTWCYGGVRPGHQFYFLSRDLVRFILERLGFELVRCDDPYRDLVFVARKVREVTIPLTSGP